jgi:hypothetical protein
MHFSLYNQFGAMNSPPVWHAVQAGLTRLGHTVDHHNDSADAAVIWSQLWAGRMRPNQQVWHQYRQANKPVLVVEIGALQRGVTWRVMPNGQNCLLSTNNTSRRRQHLGIDMLDWHCTGKEIIVALQRADSNQWAGQPSMEDWVDNTIASIRQHTDRPIVVRPHPRYRLGQINHACEIRQPERMSNTYDDYNIAKSVKHAWALVNHNSNPGVTAVLHGTPAFVGPSSMAESVANLDFSTIENPLRPDRTQWVNDLAWSEWTIDEISQGQGLDHAVSMLAQPG